MFKSTGV